MLLEASLLPLSVRHDAQLATVAEKLRRLPDNDPLYRSATSSVPQTRLVECDQSWQKASDVVLQSLQMNPERLNKMGGEIVISKTKRRKYNYDIRNR